MSIFKIFSSKEKAETPVELKSWTVTWYVKSGWSDSTWRQSKVFIKHKDAKEYQRRINESAKFIGCWIKTDIYRN